MSDVFYNKQIKCIYCNHEFETYKVRINKSKFVKRDADYCPYHEEERYNPVLYEINVCPSCGFAFTDNYSVLKDDAKNNIQENFINKLNKVPKLCNERTVSNALYAYKLALLTSLLSKQDNLILANLALRIAWLNRYLENKDEEYRFLRNALDLYIDIYQKEDLNKVSMDKYLLIYLIGELYGRLGEHKEISKWFSMIIEDKSATPKILRLTKDRWEEYREIMAAKKISKI